MPPRDDVRVLRRGRSSLEVAADGAVVRWRSHDAALPLLVDRAASAQSGAAFAGALPGRTGAVAAGLSTVLHLPDGSVDLLDGLVPATEPVGRAEPGTALVRLLRGRDTALDVVHRLRLLPQGVTWFRLNGLAMGYLQERKITVDGGAVQLRDAEVQARLQAPAGAWAALTVTVDGHLPAHPQRLLEALRAHRTEHRGASVPSRPSRGPQEKP